MKNRFTFTLASLLLPILAIAQAPYEGTTGYLNNHKALQFGSPHKAGVLQNAFETAFNETAKGLNYVEASKMSQTRTAKDHIDIGFGLPDTLVITGIPATAKVVKAFLYTGAQYYDATVPSTLNASVVNPNNVTSSFTDTLISDGAGTCWPVTGSALYRTEIDPAITGNGTYYVNITGLEDRDSAVDGTTLMIIYIDTAASYTATLDFMDGMYVGIGTGFNDSLMNFTGCTDTSWYSNAFILGEDIQANFGLTFWDSLNRITDTFPRNFWDLYTSTSIVTPSQTKAHFVIPQASIGADCYFVGMYGLYFQTCSQTIPKNDSTCSGHNFTPSICYVTADSSFNHNEVVWQRDAIDTLIYDSFTIYRGVTQTQYIPVGEVSIHSPTEFIDTGSKPNVTSYFYKLGISDTCKTINPLSPFQKTVLLQSVIGFKNSVNLSWNYYLGDSVSYYRILRDDSGKGNWHILDSVPGGVNSYTDLNAPINPGLRYVLNTVWTIVCSPYALAPPHHNNRFYSRNILPMDNESYSNTSSFFILGIAQYINPSNVLVYPDPIKDILTIVINQPLSGTISITDILGRNVYESPLNCGTGSTSETYNLNGIPAGVYLLTIESGGYRLDKKIIKL